MNETVREWIAKAEADHRVARRELNSDQPSYDAVCFHAQQSIEKLLKAALVHRQTLAPKTHDLVKLAKLVQGVDSSLIFDEVELHFLSRASVEYRYPGESADQQDADRAIDACEQARDALLRWFDTEAECLMDVRQLKQKLEQFNQDHLLRFWDELDEAGREKLRRQLEALDLPAIAQLSESHVRNKPPVPMPRRIEPVNAYPRVADQSRRQLYDDARRRGAELLRAGKVGAFLVAGGQGTRLGYDGPKGEFPVTPIRNKPLFQVFAEQLLAHSRDAGRTIPWYIMTSDVNDARTREFFDQNKHFGYPRQDVFFFQQGMMPAFGLDGRLLLAEKDSLALSPDGHGGSLRAIARSGALDDMKRRGVEHLSYFQVDNPLVHCIDTLFLGLHDLTGSEMSSKMIPKAHALEKVGVFVIGDGVLQVIEYSDLPEDLARQTTASGTLAFNAGSIAIHALRVSVIERLNGGGRLQLPWHRAEKKVPHVDDHGRPVNPDKPNAVKLEQFVFDAIPLAKNAIVYETDRAEEFSPVKNAEGDDSSETSRRDQSRRAARWLAEAGVKVPTKNDEPDAVIEISPLFAPTAGHLRQRELPGRIDAGQRIYLSPPKD
jgi:UDP-N-acetylglucosamine/UDP-N-acetylgalactosamine diphosphorylase